MQRRRKPKAAPANVFAGGQKPKKPKKTNPIQTTPAPPMPVKQPPQVEKIPEKVEVKPPEEIIPEITTTQEEENLEVVESQILGTPRRKTQGLKKEDEKIISEEKEDVSAIDMEVQEALDRAKKAIRRSKIDPKEGDFFSPSETKEKENIEPR